MNKQSYERLPADLRAVIDSVSGEYGREVFKHFWNTRPYEALETWVTQMGGQLHLLSPEEYRLVDASTRSVTEEWISILNASSYPGERMVQQIRQLGERYGSSWENSRSMQIMQNLATSQ